MMNPNVQTPIFSRPVVRRASMSMTVGKKDEAPMPVQPNLRIIQLETAQKEACNVLKTLCEDAATRLNITDTVYEIDDILSGIMVLGNLYKRVGHEKIELDNKIAKMAEEFREYKKDKKSSIEHLEDVILKLQNENIKAQDHLTEVKLKHGQKMAIASKEISAAKESLEIAKQDYERLEAKMHAQERKIMDLPRMEEQYLRNARSMVRQQEVANTVKEMGWKKLEEEVKSLNFWKNKAKSLEETVYQQKIQVERLEGQTRANLSKYQKLLAEYNQFKRLNPMAQTTKKSAKGKLAQLGGVTFSEQSGNNGESGVTRRPASASAALGNRPRSARAGTGTGTNNSSNSGGVKNIFGDGNYDRTADEIAKLKAAVAKKDDHIIRLTRQLCYTRARPLLGMVEDGTEEFFSGARLEGADGTTATNASTAGGGVGGTAGASGEHKSSKLTRSQTYSPGGQVDLMAAADTGMFGVLTGAAGEAAARLADMYYPDEESITDSFLEEERQREEARFDNARRIQQEFNGRIDRARESNPPHIRAIRKARTFAAGIADT